MALGLWLGLAASAAHAQGFKWWTSERFKSELALSADQATRLDAVYQAAAPSLQTQKAALDKLQGELAKMVAEGRADETVASDLIAKVESARAELGRTRALMLYRMRRILTSDQHLKLKVLFDEHERERRRSTRGRR